MNKVIEDDADELETHFVENPFIKLREKATQKNNKVLVGEEELTKQAAAENDVYIMQDTGKFVVQDLERMQKEKDDKKAGRKKSGYGVDSDTDSDDEEVIAKKGSTSRQIKKGLKEYNLKKRETASVHINKG